MTQTRRVVTDRHSFRRLPDGLKPDAAKFCSLPRLNGLSNSALINSQRLTLVSFDLPKGELISGAAWHSATQAAVTPANQWFAFFDKYRNLLAITADDTTTAWAANARKPLGFTVPYTTTYEGVHYCGIMVNAATPPSLWVVNGATFIHSDPPITIGHDATNTGLTNPASCPNPTAALSAAGAVPYVYLL